MEWSALPRYQKRVELRLPGEHHQLKRFGQTLTVHEVHDDVSRASLGENLVSLYKIRMFTPAHRLALLNELRKRSVEIESIRTISTTRPYRHARDEQIELAGIL